MCVVVLVAAVGVTLLLSFFLARSVSSDLSETVDNGVGPLSEIVSSDKHKSRFCVPSVE